MSKLEGKSERRMGSKTDYSSFSDSELTFLFGKGDAVAFTEIYKRYHGSLYIHVFNKLRNREDARDIVQNLFSSFWDRRDDIKLETKLSAYLFTAARYQVFNYISHSKTVTKYIESIRVFEVQSANVTDHAVREKQLLSLIQLEIDALPSKMREVFELSRKQNLSYREIAEQLKISEKTVKTQINNSLKILKGKFGEAILISLIFNNIN